MGAAAVATPGPGADGVLRVVAQRGSAAAVTAYLAGGRGDYYAEGLEAAGEWGGVLAGRLGLAGAVERADFAALCRNETPGSGAKLTPRTGADRRVGYDFTFNAPKSVSVLFGLTADPALLAAFRAAVADTMAELEPLADTRVRAAGAGVERRTGNLLYATFVHTTARPVDGHPDPHLHAHCFVFNVTHDPVEGRLKAVDLGEIKRRAPYFEAAFHSRLAANLRALGFDIRPTARGWEVAGVADRVLNQFSRRTAQVERAARAAGITDPAAKAALGAKTRDGKRTDLSADALRRRWWAALGADDRRAVSAVLGRDLDRPAADPNVARPSLAFAADHLFERLSAVPVYTLLAAALRHGVGRVTVEELRLELAASDLLVRERDGRDYVTSRAVLEEEQAMLAFARAGRGACRPLARDYTPTDDRLGPDQRAVVRHVLSSGDRVMLVRGAAGTGKTTILRETVTAVERAGRRVVMLAPSAEAARSVLRADGFADADTVARFLVDDRFRETARGQLLWVDEAGLLGSRTLARLFVAAGSLGARVVLAGDARQHAAVERGSPLRLLEDHAGLPVAAVTAVRRQSGRYRAAAELLGAGRTLAGFDALHDLGWVVELTGDELYTRAAADVRAARQAGKSVLVVCPTHAEGGRVTAAVRADLRAAGLLAADERPFSRLVSKGLTAAERRTPVAYTPGDVVEFTQHAAGFRKGRRYTVTTTGRGAVAVTDAGGRSCILPLARADRFEVYTPAALPLAVGDRVRVTRNGRPGRARLDNGRLLTVVGFTPAGDLVADGGVVVPREYGHLAHGYVVTSHAAQGKTVDRVVMVQGADSLPASGAAQFYVSATRGREAVTVYTDDRAGLRRAIQRIDPRLAAVELMTPAATHPAWAAWLVRRARAVARVTAAAADPLRLPAGVGHPRGVSR